MFFLQVYHFNNKDADVTFQTNSANFEVQLGLSNDDGATTEVTFSASDVVGSMEAINRNGYVTVTGKSKFPLLVTRKNYYIG